MQKDLATKLYILLLHKTPGNDMFKYRYHILQKKKMKLPEYQTS